MSKFIVEEWLDEIGVYCFWVPDDKAGCGISRAAERCGVVRSDKKRCGVVRSEKKWRGVDLGSEGRWRLGRLLEKTKNRLRTGEGYGEWYGGMVYVVTLSHYC